ncbi:HDOD domain-containing protein [Shewanella sp. OMA3-2]|uniref:HDOD domain-containing protein n=1 Tax=Shewanella sp. OMA3-2 TaxID=2908650 RepID=UPI001F24DD5B|nr:HDOD domain-containing protein [Shewanella sp. OMA3-2]UJF21362.1 HDOD domain-containing protein [Shewanella sp. OMA3-2]
MTANQSHKGVEYWTKRISDQEMPALCSTVRDLEQLAKDDVSSLSLLGRSVMHDNALTSRILRVANSATYNKGINQVSTVSRAAVVLGFDTIRNICLTARLLSSLLESHNLSDSVFKRLLKLMAQSFHAAMIARMMVSDRDEALREEVFIATLLYRIGESAFWSTGGELLDELDAKLLSTQDGVEQLNIIRAELGTSFNQLTQGIARNWGLGDLLLKALNNPDERMPEIRCIFIADKLAESIAQPQLDPQGFQKRLQQAADMLDVSLEELNLRLIRCNQVTHKLAVDYGAKVLVEFIPNTANVFESLDAPQPINIVREANLMIQLAKLRELTGFAINKTDFNQIMQTALEGIFTGVGVDRCGALLLSPNRKTLLPRVSMGDDAQTMKTNFVIELTDQQSIFAQCIEQKKPYWIPQVTGTEPQSVTADMTENLSREGFLIAPLMVGTKVLGVFYADRHASFRRFEAIDFDTFTHFSQLANVCFGVAMK